MNRLEEYIEELAPDIWLNSNHVNGYGVTQPSDNTNISTFSNIGSSGSAANGIVDNITILPPTFKSSGGLNNLPYRDINMDAGITSKLQMRLYEFCFWKGSLTQPKIRQIQSYLKQKYNI